MAVFRAGSLRGAARALGVNHATVNRRLRLLESALGSKLFDRGRRGFLPTQAGERLLASAEQVEEALFTAQRNIAGRDSELSGNIRVSLPYALARGLLAANLCAFQQRYLGIDLDLNLTDMFSDLTRLEADVSIRMAHEVTDDVVGRRLGQYAKSIYAAPDVASRLNQDVPDCEPEPVWLGWHGGDGDATWVRQTPYPHLAVRHNAPSHALQIELARAGAGLTMLPCFLGDREPGLVRVPGAVPIPDRSIWLLLRSDLRRLARVRAFVDFIATAIRSHRPLLEGRPDAVANSSIPLPVQQS